MTRRTMLGLLAVGTIAVTSAVTGSGARAGDLDPPHADVGDDLDSVEISPADAASAEDYWTSARMSQAMAVDVEPVIDGEPTADGALVDDASGTTPFRVDPRRISGTLADPDVATEAVKVRRSYKDLPDRTVGRVFFTDDRGGDFSCSGAVLNGKNRSVVWTAGHCVETGADGGFHTNWIFVPGWGSCRLLCEPYGTWSAKALLTTPQWATDGDFRYDMGAAVVSPLDGRKLGHRVGGQGFATGQPQSQSLVVTAGYPADRRPFTGNAQWMCVSPTTGVDQDLPGPGPDPTSIGCNMGGGSSGGPWLIELGDNGYGYVNGAISYRYRNGPDTLYSPYYGDEAADLYRRASNVRVPL